MKKNSDRKLIEAAKKAARFSHSHHSEFKVGAAILTGSGKIYKGTNIEFDAYTLTVCAERAALFNAVSNGDKRFIKIAIATTTTGFKFPCGLCRQALVEFNPEMELLLINKSNRVKKLKLKKLIPHHFKL